MTLLSEPDAFFTDHRLCGELDAGVDGPIVWIVCDWGLLGPGGNEWPLAILNSTPEAGACRGPLAAVLVPDNAPRRESPREPR